MTTPRLISPPPLALLIAVVTFAMVFPDSAQAQSKKRTTKDPATIYVIRGGGGYFPNLGTVINEKFEEKGLNVVDFRYHERSTAAKRIASAYKEGELPHGIILIGYSLGGCGVIDVSKTLQKEGIPVRLLFLIETINPLQTVPANVQECFNLYHFPAILGAPVRADSPQTKLTNFEAYTDAGLGLEYSHFAMPFVEEVHELIASRLIAAINTKAPSGSTPKPSKKETVTGSETKKSSESTATAAAPAKEKKPGIFSGLFSKPSTSREEPASAVKPGPGR